MKSLQGHFLAASPHLPDSNFYRSVVFMLQHDEEGALGVVLNRPSEDTVSQIWEILGIENVECDRIVHVGGPVDGPIMAVHAHEELAESEVIPGVFVSTDRDLLAQIVERPEGRFRVFTGYAGWGAGQLDAELCAGGWLTAEATPADVFYQGDDLWKKVTSSIGREILAAAVSQAANSGDPSLN